MNKSEILEFCNANRVAYLATLEDGAPRVRAMGIYRIGEDGIIIQTFKFKDVYKQMSASPDVELDFHSMKDGMQVRIRGKVKPLDDIELKKQVLEERPNLKKFVSSPEDVGLFLLKNGVAHVWTMATNADPKVFIDL